jgi:Zn-dependent protease with chaperone function
VNVAACLLAYNLIAAVIAPPILRRLTRSGLAPRLGVLAWTATAISVVASWPVAVGLLGADLIRSWRDHRELVRGCLFALHGLLVGRAGVAVQAALLIVAVLALTALGVLAWRTVDALRRARTDTLHHAHTARLIGTPGPEGTLVLDSPQRGVYCVAGRPAAIVITRGTLAALNPRQLAAVLAHERAHLAGHHHLLLACTRALASTLPGIALFPEAASEVARLLEMRADDAAASRHAGHTLVGALLALATPAGNQAEVPTPAFSALGGGVGERAQRMLTPVSRLRLAASLAGLSAAAFGLLIAPLALITLMLGTTPLCGAMPT